MTVFDIRQGVRDFFGKVACAVGLHKWGPWLEMDSELSEAMGEQPGLEVRWCERDSLCGCHTGQSRPVESQGGKP